MAYPQLQNELLRIISTKPDIRVSGLLEQITPSVSLSTINRGLKDLVNEGLLIKSGSGRNTSYTIAPGYQLLNQRFDDTYFDREIDERDGNKNINPEIFDLLANIKIFTAAELSKLNALQEEHNQKITTLSTTLRSKETERLSIELSWKSSQIEGNTYSLLETEALLADKTKAPGKSSEEATMLLNHKTALDYIFNHNVSVDLLTITSIEDIHYLLVKDMGVARNLRKRAVGITGTSYIPPDNEFQLKEYLQAACDVINGKNLIFEKAMLAVLLISYIQPFEDGNKRTGRITGNGLLIENGYCPLSYRSVAPIDYKKAMIFFYEQNNLTAYKALFIEQFEYAVKHYYR